MTIFKLSIWTAQTGSLIFLFTNSPTLEDRKKALQDWLERDQLPDLPSVNDLLKRLLTAEPSQMPVIDNAHA